MAFSGATDFMPELNRWLQIVEMNGMVCVFVVFVIPLLISSKFKMRLTSAMIIDFAGCWIIEVVCKYLFADLQPKKMITAGRERREQRRLVEVQNGSTDVKKIL